MHKFSGTVIFLPAISCFAQTLEVDPCALNPKAELTKIFGEIKEGPKTKEDQMDEHVRLLDRGGRLQLRSLRHAERNGECTCGCSRTGEAPTRNCMCAEVATNKLP